MTVGDILDRGLRLTLRRLPTFYAINLIAFSPLLVYVLLIPAFTSGGDPFEVLLFELVAVMFVSALLQPLGTAATLHIISKEFVDERVGTAAGVKFALQNFGRLLIASLLTNMVVGAGYAFCGVPEIIFSVWLAFVPQVIVVEGLGITECLGRSKALTEGYFGRVLGLLALFLVITIIFYATASSLEFLLPSREEVPTEEPFTPFGDFAQRFTYRNYVINAVVEQLVGILVQAFDAVCMTLLYFDLRIRKEGFDLELAAKQQGATTS